MKPAFVTPPAGNVSIRWNEILCGIFHFFKLRQFQINLQFNRYSLNVKIASSQGRRAVVYSSWTHCQWERSSFNHFKIVFNIRKCRDKAFWFDISFCDPMINERLYSVIMLHSYCEKVNFAPLNRNFRKRHERRTSNAEL